MNEQFQELVKSLSLAEIRFLESHEKVLEMPEANTQSQVEIKTEQAFPTEDPLIENDTVLFRPRYTFTFSINEKDFFSAQYIIVIAFKTEKTEKVKELLAVPEVKDFFLKKQLNRTLWSVLRGTVLDAFNRHSLQPLPLPWII
ncbi:MAG: hypothetical protein J6K96_02760 [Treponema sp.]|nr:hypothetical protein [Treponema sp.]